MPEKVIKFFIRLRCMFIFNKTYRKKKRTQLWGNIFRKRFFSSMQKKFNKKTFFCIGDSHTDVFSENTYAEKVPLAPDLFSTIFTGNIHSAPQFVTYHLDGVLAYSLNRRNTTNRGVEKIEWLIKNGFLPKGCRIVTIFGEPDCRVHVKKEADRQNCPVDVVMDNIIQNYGTFLVNLKKQGFQVYVYSPIASQKGNMEIDPVFKRFNSETERNKILLGFENKLKKFCESNNIVFISILQDLLNPDMTSKSEYYLPDGVHLNDKGRLLVLNAFSKIGDFQ